MGEEPLQQFIIAGKRVNLRPMTASDLDDYQRWSDPNLKAWEYDGPWFDDDPAQLAAKRRRQFEKGQQPPYKSLEVETVDGEHVGWAVVYYRSDDPHMTEVGIDIVEEHLWNRGLGTEALALWIEYQFEARGLMRIGYSTWAGNKRALAIGRKLGFIEEARIRRGCQVKGRYYDRIKMGILREEWEAVKDRCLSCE